jgi:DNA polymerase epsilon subunit 1
MLHPELASDYSFPILPGSHLKLSNAVLQLVKSLMQVLSLDKNITLEARLLRKELLQSFEIREFSNEARFENPSASLRMQQVICENCTMARDLDFCRDEDLIPDIGPDGKVAGETRAWKCSFCHAEYPRLDLEERLIASVEGMVTEWCTQDLRCVKCKSVRINDFMEHCSCGGAWGETIRKGDIERRLGVYGNVANVYGLRMLSDVVGGVKANL